MSIDKIKDIKKLQQMCKLALKCLTENILNECKEYIYAEE